MSWGYGGYPAQQGTAWGTPSSGPPGVPPDLWEWFNAVDQDRSGHISSLELQRALLNGDWSPFNEETCRLMVGMFDRDRTNTIDIHEFVSLWNCIQQWKQCFERFDRNRSGSIDALEFHEALTTFGYRLSMNFSNLVVSKLNRNGGRIIHFDDFIKICVMLKSLSDQFRAKDTNQAGVVNLQYEEFLHMVVDCTFR
ncbi:peflin-like isoform X2 [Limulus polyphemus]|uniref:Peflin-like isoform X2 n=1 Tax=Limulus polyphemus TaxID=6850 RepID=A0ABM1SNY0_LIMPO|nr:peflin-like isoform X2 [Limulus polyphemus]XP_013777758.1 peflin-like isoform X2 [Limulus polyphemus]XP_013777759.1 peflin-like isoform X2 [Limulus polyphemus]XP_013777760.1 peflin-like isoform X2 [Limulus polyphemus]XP_022245336.1 peflin-like isoform X2 [Limulus polyphemus]XP_022245337.1 peflin-like isoform X2 [Limulus polyphemus]